MAGTVFRRSIHLNFGRIDFPGGRERTVFPMLQNRTYMVFLGNGTTCQFALYQRVEY